MARRYGRKQKRKAREEIAKLQAGITTAREFADRASSRAYKAEIDAANAKNIALTEFMRCSGLMADAIQRIGHSLGTMLGKELMSEAQKILDCRQPDTPPVCFTVEGREPTMQEFLIRGTIPSVHYCIRVSRL